MFFSGLTRKTNCGNILAIFLYWKIKWTVAFVRRVRSALRSWLVRWTPDWVLQVRALDRVIVLRSWARHCTLTMPLSTQEYKWVLTNCWGNLLQFVGVAWGGQSSASCYGNWIELSARAMSQLGWVRSFAFPKKIWRK